MKRVVLVLALIFADIRTLAAQSAASLSPAAREFVSVPGPVVALTHVKVIDGTGAPPAADQTVVIDNGKITAVGSAATVRGPAGATVMALAGSTVIPGLFGLHDPTFCTTSTLRRV